ncbi:MAG: FHA domain-containing protein, partial [Holophagales bacterium]|nr:FHA domain-containing protein [Holophagales bacterium]
RFRVLPIPAPGTNVFSMLELRYHVDGEEKRLVLSKGEVRFGRSGENEVMLPDYSVSRRHATIRAEGRTWVVTDLRSTNGVQLNGQSIDRAEIRAGDTLKMGVFEVHVHPGAIDEAPGPAFVAAPQPEQQRSTAAPGQAPPGSSSSGFVGLADRARSEGFQAPPGPPAVPDVDESLSSSAISNATIVRPLKDLSAELSLLESVPAAKRAARDSGAIRREKREALDEVYSSHVFGLLIRLARMLIATDSDDEILGHVMEIAFDIFPVDRGFIFLGEGDGELRCVLARFGERTEPNPQKEMPISKTMLESVMREKVALLTYDALSDQRLAGTESVRIHQIRAAMLTPLWSGERIIGVMQLDTPHHTGSFTRPDVDLLATLANYCAVALERNHNAREAEFQREVRNRLQRYHSPAVIEEVMREGTTPEAEIQRLKRAEVTVLFADIVGFTAYSEKSAPEEMAALMEGYFTYAVEAIFEHGGTLDKFIGDCVMAFFGAPFEQPDHAYRAVAAAVKIREELARWNAERRELGLPEVRTRVAINTGPVVVGDIGSNRRVDYTVLGNTVNVTARLEQMVAEPGDIVLGQATYEQMGGEFACEPLGPFQLKGLSQKIAAYRVV